MRFLLPLSTFAACALAVLAAPASSDVGGVSSYIQVLVGAITGLNTQLYEPGVQSSYLGALKVSNAALTLVRSLNSATTYLDQIGQLSDAATGIILGNLTLALPIVQNATQRVADLKPAFQNLHVVMIARTDVMKLQTSTSSFTAEIVKVVPPAYTAKATSSKQAYDAALAVAAKAYA